MAQRTVKKTLLLLACSDRGLCGAFNANLIRLTTDRAKELQVNDIDCDIVCLGKKAGSTLRYLGYEPVAVHQGLIDAPEYSQAQELIEPMMEQFLTGDYDAVEIVYSRFISAARQVPDCIDLLPAGGAQEADASGALRLMLDGDYIFHPDARSLLDSLIPQTVKTAFFSALLQTSAGEHSARRLAMKNATDAAGDLIKLLITSIQPRPSGKNYSRNRRNRRCRRGHGLTRGAYFVTTIRKSRELIMSATASTGRVVQVIGSTLDAEFDTLPAIYNALTVQIGSGDEAHSSPAKCSSIWVAIAFALLRWLPPMVCNVAPKSLIPVRR